MPKPKFQDGSKVIYRGFIFDVVNSYFRQYDSPGWFYNFHSPDLQAIPESEIRPIEEW